MSDKGLLLPPGLIGHSHLSRLIRELEVVENDIEAQKARHPKTALKEPDLSQTLADCVELNKIKITDSQERMHFKAALGVMKDKAPTMHFTFAVEADPESLAKLVAWVRTEIHPQALITVGLQPSLVGGTYLRTPNHVHDFSLRALLHDKRTVIVKELEAILHER